MAPFNRSDYEYIFEFAKRVYRQSEVGSSMERASVEVMNMIEEVIGQQTDFPENARNYRRERA